jgi:hypothetical protein
MARTNPRRWIVQFGRSSRVYYTQYHAEQFVRALLSNGTPCTILECA